MRGARIAAAYIGSEIAGQIPNEELHCGLMCAIENGGSKETSAESNMSRGGTVSIVMGAHSETPGLSAEKAHCLKDAFGVTSP